MEQVEVFDEAVQESEMHDFIHSAFFDKPLPDDWEEANTWGDPDDEWIPDEYKKNVTDVYGLPVSKSEPEIVLKYGTSGGAKLSWIHRRRSFEDQLRIAVTNRDAKTIAKIQRRMRSGDQLYKSLYGEQ